MIFNLLFFFLLLLALIFLWIVYTRFFGAEFVKMPKKARRAMLKMLKLTKKDVFYDLGCGDGQLLIEASPKVKEAIGIEIDFLRFLIAKIRTRKMENVKIIFGNLFNLKLSKNAKVAIFLSKEVHQKLAEKLKKEKISMVAFYKWPSSHLSSLLKSYDKKNNIFLYKLL